MQFKKIIFIIVLFLLIIFSTISVFMDDVNVTLQPPLLTSSSYSSTQALTPSIEILTWKVNFSAPVHITIPKIQVDTVIEHVGLTPEWDMGIPKIFTNTAWFNLGTFPWQTGSAVIAGHFGFINKEPGAFNNLSKLTKWDTIMIEDINGEIATFVVRESKIYNQNEIVPNVFYSDDGKSHLNLITCQWAWNKTQKSYNDRLVIFTDKE